MVTSTAVKHTHPNRQKKKKKLKKKNLVLLLAAPPLCLDCWRLPAKDPCEQAQQRRSPLELFTLWIKHIQLLGAVPRAPRSTRGAIHIPWKTLLVISALWGAELTAIT